MVILFDQFNLPEDIFEIVFIDSAFTDSKVSSIFGFVGATGKFCCVHPLKKVSKYVSNVILINVFNIFS